MKFRKLKTDIICGVEGCNKISNYIGGDGILYDFCFVCKEHKNWIEKEGIELKPIKKKGAQEG